MCVVSLKSLSAVLLFSAFSPSDLGKIPTSCLPLRWLLGAVAQAGNRLTASLAWKGMGKGVYPQSDGSLALVDIDASKGFVGLWVHLSFAIFAIFDVKRQLKSLRMAYDQVQTCLIFPL